jgi:5-methylcytosine-specific restriction enzyme A
MNWMISADSKMYDHSSSFEHYGLIDWRQETQNLTLEIQFVFIVLGH